MQLSSSCRLRNRDLSWKSFIVGVKSSLQGIPFRFIYSTPKYFQRFTRFAALSSHEVEITTDAACTVSYSTAKAGSFQRLAGLYASSLICRFKAKLLHQQISLTCGAMFMHAFKSLL
jgi:hypothetical protein